MQTKKAYFFLILISLSISILLKAQTKADGKLGMVKGVTAHRGNSVAFPENTLEAFQGGIDAHADWVELDIHKTKDGQIVVSHDKNTKRASGIDLDIASSTYKELLKVDVATEFRKKNNLSLEQCPPKQIPLLRDAIKLILKEKKARLSIQPKMDCVAEAIAIVKELHAESMVGFNDANLVLMSKVKLLAPKIPVFWDRPATADIDADIKTAKEKGFESMVMHYSTITSEKINKIKAAGIHTGAWTVDDPTIMQDLLKLGIERIYTNNPKLLIELKKGRI